MRSERPLNVDADEVFYFRLGLFSHRVLVLTSRCITQCAEHARKDEQSILGQRKTSTFRPLHEHESDDVSI